MSIEAMKQALDALEEHGTHYARHEDDYIKAITALREAIEFQEMVAKGTKAWADTPDGWVDDLRGGVEKQEPVGYLYDWLNPDSRDEVIRDWFAASTYVIEKDKGFNVRPLYTAPREWVGLTDGEMQEAMEYWSDSLRSSYGGAESASEEYVDMVLTWRYIEAKLKEKNYG
jgi:hypothetical protein